MVDYRINLAKTLTSSAEERTRFYRSMLVYLMLCAVVMVGVTYLSALNLRSFLENRRERKQLLVSASAISGFDAAAFKNPNKAYSELKAYSNEIGALKAVLGQRVQLLPVIDSLFAELPPGASVQRLSATREKMDFGMILPLASGERSDSVRKLTEAWEGNEELMERVSAIRPLAGERRTRGSNSVYYVQFECVLRK